MLKIFNSSKKVFSDMSWMQCGMCVWRGCGEGREAGTGRNLWTDQTLLTLSTALKSNSQLKGSEMKILVFPTIDLLWRNHDQRAVGIKKHWLDSGLCPAFWERRRTEVKLWSFEERISGLWIQKECDGIARVAWRWEVDKLWGKWVTLTVLPGR